MIRKLIVFIKSHKSFFLYIGIGFTGLTLDFLSFLLMVRLFRVPVLIANPISMSVGIVNNFFINAYFNFRETSKLLIRLLSFYAVGIVGILVSTGILWFFNDVVGVMVSQALAFLYGPLASYRVELVKAVSIVVVGVMQYFLNKYISFGK